MRRVLRGDFCTARLYHSSHLPSRSTPFHSCQFERDHLGVHLCWCGDAFNDRGEVFSQLPLAWDVPSENRRHTAWYT